VVATSREESKTAAMAEFGVRRFDTFPYIRRLQLLYYQRLLISSALWRTCTVNRWTLRTRLIWSRHLGQADQGLTNQSTHPIIIEVSFGKILRQLRNEQSIGIKKLAPALGVDYSYLSKLENESIGPSAEMVARVATYFNYDYNRLLLSAGKVPDEVLAILRENPDEALEFLRERFGSRHDT
jgi:transcriptional regulator with XRE-family HTH domain